jgi:type II secretory pathway pseudopilin PulG
VAASRFAGEGGLTLIEICVTMMLVAIVLAVALPAFQSATDANLKATAVKLSAAARACYGESEVRGATLRLAYDLDRNGWWVEAYPGTYQISGTEQDLDRVRDDDKKKDDDAKRKKELEDRYSTKSASDEQSSAPVPKFVPVGMDFIEPEVLPRGVRFIGVRTPQFRQIIKTGKAYTHFFPNGWAERTLVYLQDTHGAEMTLEMEPLSGRVVIWDGQLDYRDLDERHARGEDGSK